MPATSQVNNQPTVSSPSAQQFLPFGGEGIAVGSGGAETSKNEATGTLSSCSGPGSHQSYDTMNDRMAERDVLALAALRRLEASKNGNAHHKWKILFS